MGAAAQASGGGQRQVTGTVRVTLALRPRHPALLARLAQASSVRAPLPRSIVRELFLPTGRQVARVRAAMRAQGLRYESRHGLDLSFSGPASSVGAAFSAPLVAARAAGGGPARRPLTVPRPPAGIATLVQDVEGLDTRAPLRPLAAGAPAPAAAPCRPAAETGGYLPSDLGSPGGYDHSALIAGGWDGGGETVAVVALSNYRHRDVAAYQDCFGLGVPVRNVAVDGGTRTRSGAVEVALDVETVVSAAPGLDGVDVYVLRPTATMARP